MEKNILLAVFLSFISTGFTHAQGLECETKMKIKARAKVEIPGAYGLPRQCTQDHTGTPSRLPDGGSQHSYHFTCLTLNGSSVIATDRVNVYINKTGDCNLSQAFVGTSEL